MMPKVTYNHYPGTTVFVTSFQQRYTRPTKHQLKAVQLPEKSVVVVVVVVVVVAVAVAVVR
jgi:hypothetical protein